jgi:uncharacterized protein (TIGR02271 family)
MDSRQRSPSITGEPDSICIPVIEESVAVYKNVVDNGGLRIRKLVHGEVVEIDEPLAREGVNCRRVPIGRDVDGPVSIRYEGGATIIPIVEERLIVRRQLVLVEEIHISRSSFTQRVPQSVTVRREEVIVERQGPGETDWRIEQPPEDN